MNVLETIRVSDKFENKIWILKQREVIQYLSATY